MEVFAQTAPGLEPALTEELAELGFEGRVEPGGVTLDVPATAVARLNLHLACASRVLVTVGRFRATALGELERKGEALPWDRFLAPGRTPVFRVTCRKSRLYHTGAVSERLGRATGSSALPDGPDAPDVTPFVVRIVRDRVVIRADSSGAHLHRRGYRLATAKAPLRETLAAGILRRAGWTPDRPLVDPLCGSGTFVIEAAMRAVGRAPGENRSFAFQDWPGADAEAWRALRADALSKLRPAPAPLMGSDRDDGAVDAARGNAERAGVAGATRFRRCAVSTVEAPPWTGPVGVVVANPPWGRRMGRTRALGDLHARLGQVARGRFPGWTLALVSPSPALVNQADRRARRAATFASGGISVDLWLVDEL